MSIAFIVPGSLDQLTGGYIFDRRLVEGLRASGRRVNVHELPGQYPNADNVARRAATALLDTFSDGAIAVVDGLALPAFADCLSPANAARLKLVAFVHHPLALETGLDGQAITRFASLEARLLARVRGVLCPSRSTAWAIEEYGIHRERIEITPPGVDRPTSRQRERPARSWIQLLTVGSVTPRKGHRLLIEALADLADLPWRLLCIGSLTRDRDAALDLERTVARHGLSDRVTLAGEWPSERLSPAYADADVFVLPSYHEGYGMVFAEALVHALPIVATTAGAIPQTVPAEASLLVPPGDRAALATALRMILERSELRARLAKAARSAGERLPDWPAATTRWIAALDRLVA